MQNTIRLCLLLLLWSALAPAHANSLSAEQLFKRSISYHDPDDIWHESELSLHIEEPRVGNPTRASSVFLSLKSGEFNLHRTRRDRVASYHLNKDGELSVFLDDEVITDDKLIEEYLLQPERIKRYRDFYRNMLGLPMSLSNNVQSIEKLPEADFNGQQAHRLETELNTAVFSNKWILYIATEDYRLLGADILDEEGESERLVFTGEYQQDTLQIPRFRHWYDLESNKYLGSDMIVQNL